MLAIALSLIGALTGLMVFKKDPDEAQEDPATETEQSAQEDMAPKLADQSPEEDEQTLAAVESAQTAPPQHQAEDTHGGDHDMGKDAQSDTDMGHDMGHGTGGAGMDHGNDSDMGQDGHTDMDHELADLAPPQTPEEIDAFVAAVRASGEAHIHDADSPKLAEHTALLDLVPPSEATHIAIGSGDWFDPDNWHTGTVPGDDAKIVIPNGVHLEYGAQSDVRLMTLRVDGSLEFATDLDSKMVIDTFVVAPSGELVIGTEEDPIQSDTSVDIIFSDNGAIDVTWDTHLLSKGIISHGDVQIHGSEKVSHAKVDETPMEGDTYISFDGTVPDGWAVGDTIVIAGTHYDGYRRGSSQLYTEPEDEVRLIAEIKGDTVFFEDPLVFDHDTPRDDLFTSVGNYSRNVTFSTENADDIEIHERAHAMFMHSNDVDIRYAAFHELGRTDKSEEAFDVADFATLEDDSNVKGRYALHLHRLGTDAADDPAIIQGNAVFGSPGWGFVHHDSNAILDENASYDTFGAGFVTESGNETGAWTGNLAIYAQGVSWAVPKNSITFQEFEEFDLAKSGDGFWSQSRMVALEDNIAASVNTGFVFFHRGPLGEGGNLDFPAENTPLPDIFYGEQNIRFDDSPILNFSGNETFAAREGLHVVKGNPSQGHDVHSVLEDFTAWEVRSGAHLEYTSHYVLKDFDLIARDSERHSEPVSGIGFASNTSDIVIVDAKIDGFREGINLVKNFTDNSKADPDEDHHFAIINVQITGEGDQYKNYDPLEDLVLDTAPDVEDAPYVDFGKPLVFQVGADTASHRVDLEGVKHDSLGTIDFPAGPDNFDLDFSDMLHILKEDGFFSDTAGEKYFFLDVYFSDRLTGEIFEQQELVKFEGDPPESWFRPQNAIDNGTFELEALEAMVAPNAIVVARPDIPEIPDMAAAHTTSSFVPPGPELDAMMNDIHTHSQTTPDQGSEDENAPNFLEILTSNKPAVSEALPEEPETEADSEEDLELAIL